MKSRKCSAAQAAPEASTSTRSRPLSPCGTSRRARLSSITLDGSFHICHQLRSSESLIMKAQALCSLWLRCSLLVGLLSLVLGCQTASLRDQQIKHATKMVVAVPFSERGQLIHQLAKQGELPVDVANVWITQWNEQTLAIAKAEKQHAAQTRHSGQPRSSRRSGMTPEQLERMIAVYDRNIKSLEATIADIESLRPARREYAPPRTSLPQLRSVTVTPAGGDGSFYVSDPSVPNSSRYYQKRGNTYYWSE
jgi:hypothetical protein